MAHIPDFLIQARQRKTEEESQFSQSFSLSFPDHQNGGDLKGSGFLKIDNPIDEYSITKSEKFETDFSDIGG